MELPFEIDCTRFNLLPMKIGTTFLESKNDDAVVCLNLQRQQLVIKGIA